MSDPGLICRLSGFGVASIKNSNKYSVSQDSTRIQMSHVKFCERCGRRHKMMVKI